MMSNGNTEPLSSGIKTLLYIVTFFIPLVGLIVGIIYLNNPLEENKRFGKSILIFAIVMMVLVCLCSFILPLLGLSLWGGFMESFFQDMPGY